MSKRFEKVLAGLDGKLKVLITMKPVKVGALPYQMPASGIYLFSEGKKHLYVGRSKRLRSRLRYHASGRLLQASFAFLLAREITGLATPTYAKEGSRSHLGSDPRFLKAFHQATKRIQCMDVRFVEESDPIGQAILEIYAALKLKTPHNKFETT